MMFSVDLEVCCAKKKRRGPRPSSLRFYVRLRQGSSSPCRHQGRTPTDKVVIFRGEESLLGSFVNVKIVEAESWCLHGELEP